MEEIAIIGIGCKLPGADDIDQFWRVLQNGENHVLEVPPDRWNLDAFYDPDPNAPGKTYVKRAGFVKNHEFWDNKVYGVNDFEAGQMDPQQRFVMDCCFKAMENAGITRKGLDGSNTGVYIGVMNSDYKSLQSTTSEHMNNYTLTGTSTSIVAARISFNFNLLGPALSLDTACSSSLLAIHLAAQALREGDCDLAFAGGVNSLMSPGIFVQLSKARMASPTGYCQAFSNKADGYARGEGAGILLMKRLKDAERDNDPIWATIMTGSNQDGHTVTPMTAPSGSQQLNLLKKVYSRYDIDPDQLEYIEAHGTGTQAGDPVEANCLGAFLQEHTKNAPRYIGSVKTNIGHLESAAGVAGVIKVLLMQKHSMIVPTLHFDEPNEKIDFDKLKLIVATKLDKWPTFTNDGTKLSCVNSFSFGGTNCHAIIKTYAKSKSRKAVTFGTEKLHIICFSGTDDTSLKNSIKHFVEHAKSRAYSISDVSFTSSIKRDHYPVRYAHVVKTMDEAIQQLEEKIPEKVAVKALQKNKYIIFVFCGMGSAWRGMCKEMMKENEIFSNKVGEIDDLLQPLTGWSIRKRFMDDYEPTDPYFGPIASFTCQVALDAVWKFWGVKPDCIIGQSVGEVAASHAAGALSLKDAVHVIYHRTYLQAKAVGGSMIVVGNYEVSELQKMLDDYPGQAVVAVHNSPKSCTLAGDTDVIKAVKERLEIQKEDLEIPMFLHDLTVTSAFHSHHMEECSTKIKEALTDLKGCKPSVKLYSTVSAKEATETDFVTAEYWAKNVREPVYFRQALQDAAHPELFNIFLEIGSKPVLAAHAKENFNQDQSKVFASMKKDMGLNCTMQTLAQLYAHGVDPDWKNVLGDNGDVMDIPQYQFNPKPNLIIPERSRLSLMGGDFSGTGHPFLRPIIGQKKDFKVVINPNRIGSVYEHFVRDSIFIPGAFYGEVGLAMAEYMTKGRASEMVVSINFKAPLVLYPGKNVELDVVTSTEEDIKTEREVTNYTVMRENQTLAVGSIAEAEVKERSMVDIDEIRDRCQHEFTKDDIYGQLKKLGFSYGTPLRVLSEAVCNDKECLVYMKLPEEIRIERIGTMLHPAILDGMLQTPGVLGTVQMNKGGKDGRDQANRGPMEILPVRIGNLTIKGSPQDNMVAYGRVIKKTEVTTHYDIILLSDDGDVIAEARNFVTQNLGIASAKKQMMYNIHWKRNGTLSSEDEIDHQYWSDILVFDNTQKKKLSGDNVISLDSNKSITTLLEQKSDLQNMKAMVYVSHQGHIRVEDTADVFNSIVDECMIIRDLILFILRKRMEIPLLVITKDAWPLSYKNGNEESKAATPSAASLWGMIRTITRELPEICLKLVDINGDFDENTEKIIYDVVNFVHPTEWEPPEDSEYVVSDNVIYSFEFINTPDTMDHKYKEVSMDEKCEVKLFSQAKNDYINPFMVYSEEPRADGKDEVSMKVDTMAIQNTLLYSTCIDNTALLHTASTAVGYPVVCLESIGYIDRERPHDKFISCYPTQAGTTIVVPKSCLISEEYLPVYHPGLMMKIVLMWSLCQNIPSKDISILYHSRSKGLMKIISLILTSQQKNVQTVSIEDLESIEHGALVSLVNLNQTNIHEVISNWIKPESISTISSLIDNFSIAIIHDQLPHVTMDIFRTEEMFSPAMLLQTIPKITEWIKLHKADITTISKSFKSGLLGRRRSSTVIPRSTDIMRLLSVSEIPFSRGIMLPPTRAVSGYMFRQDSVYIVVGGLTGLGWECVKFLAANGAGNIVCFNRREPSEDNLLNIQHLENSDSCRVAAVQVDVSVYESVKNGFDDIENIFPGSNIKGVIFGAGVLKDSFIESMDREKFSSVLSPKMKGAWNLHLLTKNLSLDYFIMHSSVTSILGNQGQTNYGTGNAFQDGLAHYRRSLGLPGQSFNWGPLDVGMLKKGESTEKVIELLKKQGYELLELEEIHHCLMTCLLDDIPQLMLAKLDLGNFSSGNSGSTALLAKFRLILPSITSSGSKDGLEENTSMALDIPLIKTLEKEHRIQILQDYMSIIACKVFAIDESMVTPDSSVVDLGIDSMLAMTIIDQVNRDTKYRIPMVILLSEGSTIRKIAEVIEQSFWEEPVTNVEEEGDEEGSDKIMEITDEEAKELTENDPNIEIMSSQEKNNSELNSIESKLEYANDEIKHEKEDVYVKDSKASINVLQKTESPKVEKTPLSETDNSKPVSFIEKDIFEMNETGDHTSLHFIKDIIFKGKGVNIDVIRICSRETVEKHTIAYTLFEKNAHCIKRSAKKSEMDFRVVTGLSVDDAYRQISSERFDFSKQGPVRFICSSSPASLRVRLVCHMIGFDSFALANFISDFQSSVVNKASKRETTLNPPTELISYVELNKIFNERQTEINNFWDIQVPAAIPVMKVKRNYISCPLTDSITKISSRKLDQNTSRNIFNLAKTMDTTLLNIFISSYQLLLRCHNQDDIVTVMTKCNLRSMMSKSSTEICNLTSDIPLFANIPTSTAISTFFKNNCSLADQCFRHAVFPLSMIQKMIASEESRQNMTSHCVVHEEVKKTVPAKSLGLQHDTLLIVNTVSNTKTIELQVQYKSQLFSDVEAKTIIDQLLQIITIATTDPHLLVRDIVDKFSAKHHNGSDTKFEEIIHEDRKKESIPTNMADDSNEKPTQYEINIPENTMSYSEYYFYERYLRENPVGHHMYADIHLRKRPGFDEIWQKAAIKMLERHSALRTVYVKADSNENYRFGVKKIEKNPEDILDFHIVKNSKDEAEYDRISRLPFDLSTKPGVRFIFSNEPTARIRIVFQHVAIDFYTMGLLLKDIREVAPAVGYGVDMPPVPSEQVKRGVIHVERAIKPMEKKLKEFWQSNLKAGVPQLTLQKSPTDEKLKGLVKPIVEVLPKETSAAILALAPQLKSTVFKFFTSIYQMYFHFMTEQDRVLISAPLDLRVHLPETRNFYENMMSAVPIFTNFKGSGDITAEEFITSNSKSISQFLAHGLYPVVLIRDLLGNKEEGKWLTKHSVVEEDMSTINYISNPKKKDSNEETDPTLGFTYETRLMVWLDRKASYIRLHLECLPELYPEKEIQMHMANILKLLNAVLSDRSLTISQLRDSIVPPIYKDTVDNAPNFIMSPEVNKMNVCERQEVGAKFLKETSMGYDHLVYAKITSENGRPEIQSASIGYRGRSKPKNFKGMPLSEVQKVYLCTYKGFRTVVLETRKKKIIFKFIDGKEVADFTRVLGNSMDELPVQNGNGEFAAFCHL